VIDTIAEFTVAQHMAGECSCPHRLFYFSYADDTGFLGGNFVRWTGFIAANNLTKKLGINPGGSVMGRPCPPDLEVKKKYLNKLLTKEQIDAAVSGVLA